MAPLPLFPLAVVLFPGALLPLHIFEPRYQQLLTDVVEGDHRFGILPPAGGGEGAEVGTIGTVARVRAVQPLEEGRSNVVVSGESRFLLEATSPSAKPYLIGDIAALEDQSDTLILPQHQMAALIALAQRYADALGRLNDSERDTEFSPDLGRFTFQVAALLDWDFTTKQHFLTLRSAAERATRLLHALPRLLAVAEERAGVHTRATTNGKGLGHGGETSLS
ncbi:MAG: LON peptidase substrate-binding domain-containing protein [Gemmatimonadota bacterium]